MHVRVRCVYVETLYRSHIPHKGNDVVFVGLTRTDAIILHFEPGYFTRKHYLVRMCANARACACKSLPHKNNEIVFEGSTSTDAIVLRFELRRFCRLHRRCVEAKTEQKHFCIT